MPDAQPSTPLQTPPPTLILLPGGLCVSGVALWVVRLSSALADRGGQVTLVLFGTTKDSAKLDLPIDPRVRVVDLGHLVPIESCQGDLSEYLPTIADETLRLTRFGTVAVLPNQHGDCYGIAAALTQTLGDRVRVIGTAHSDNAYDLRLLSHYAPMLPRLVAVSKTLEAKARSALPMRANDVAHIPYGVPMPELDVGRATMTDRPIRLLYAGRYEHRQKRVMALPRLAELLTQSGIEFELTIAGDGPARRELEDACANMQRVRVLGAQSQDELAQLLGTHDAMVLPSRYEGLSIAMLESMARGCVPIVTRCDSGSAEAIEDGVSGLIADVLPDEDELAAAKGLFSCVLQSLQLDLSVLAKGAAGRARDRYTLEQHAGRWCELLSDAVRDDTRSWPTTRPCAFTSSVGGVSGSVPEGGGESLKRVLAQLGGRAIVIHGGGRHTLDLAHLFAHADVRAVVDDDPARFGERLLGWKIISPHEAGMTGATDVVISSSMHEDAIWARRAVYEEQGLRVHRLYQAASVETKPRRMASSTRP